MALLYFSRAVTLPIAAFIGNFARVNADALAQVRSLWNVYTLVPASLAVCILYALYRRVPNASSGVRWLWAHGRFMLVTTACLDLTLIGYAAVQRKQFDDNLIPLLTAALLDVYFLTYVLFAKRVRDTFSEFPAD